MPKNQIRYWDEQESVSGEMTRIDEYLQYYHEEVIDIVYNGKIIGYAQRYSKNNNHFWYAYCYVYDNWAHFDSDTIAIALDHQYEIRLPEITSFDDNLIGWHHGHLYAVEMYTSINDINLEIIKMHKLAEHCYLDTIINYDDPFLDE